MMTVALDSGSNSRSRRMTCEASDPLAQAAGETPPLLPSMPKRTQAGNAEKGNSGQRKEWSVLLGLACTETGLRARGAQTHFSSSEVLGRTNMQAMCAK